MIDDKNRIEYQAEYSDAEPPAVALVNTAATVRESDPMELPPLEKTISTDSLEMLLESGNDVTITFSYEGLQITVDDDGQLVVRDSE